MLLRIAKKKNKREDKPFIIDEDSDLVVFYMDHYENKCSTCPFRGLCGG